MLFATNRGARTRAPMILGVLFGALLLLAPGLASAIEATALTAAGTTAPIQVTKNPVPIAPGIFITFAPGTTATCTVQATAAEWGSGGLPSSASWQPADPSGSLTNIAASTNAKLGALATALRLNCSSLTAGSVVFGVAQ